MLSTTTQSSPSLATSAESVGLSPSELFRPDIDLEVLYSLDQERIAGESDLVVELIDLYIEDASNRLLDIKQALGGADRPSLNRAAHNLMGSSSTLGAHRMALLCQKLQRPVADWRESFGALLSKLEDEFSRVRLVFAAERQRRFSCGF